MANSRRERGQAARSGREGGRTGRSESEWLARDLAEIAASLPPEQINELITQARVLSDAQAGEGTPPSAPVSATVDSPEEVVVAEGGDSFLAETERYRSRAVSAIAIGRANSLSARRDTLWATEVKVLRKKLPRASFVGKSIHTNMKNGPASVGYVDIYTKILENNERLLPETLRSHLVVMRGGVSGQAQHYTRREQTSASSAITKNLDTRLALLVDDLAYVQKRRVKTRTEYLLTRLGRKVFDDWPKWSADDEPPGVDGQGASGAADAGAR